MAQVAKTKTLSRNGRPTKIDGAVTTKKMLAMRHGRLQFANFDHEYVIAVYRKGKLFVTKNGTDFDEAAVVKVGGQVYVPKIWNERVRRTIAAVTYLNARRDAAALKENLGPALS